MEDNHLTEDESAEIDLDLHLNDVHDRELFLNDIHAGLEHQRWFAGAFQAYYGSQDQLALFCLYSLKAFRTHFRETHLFSVAVREVCLRHGLDYRDLNSKPLQKIERDPALMLEVRSLCGDPGFVDSVNEIITAMTDKSMSYLTEKKIQDAVATGIQILVQGVAGAVHQDRVEEFARDDPKDKIFSPFGLVPGGDPRLKIEGEAVKSRSLYFAIYQAIAKDERRPGLYKEYAPDFFDLIIVDECHRGSSRDESSWREILEYFEPAYQLGMTATPLREDNRDTYLYFGNPIYQYSLKQGIEDGFLAPYRVHRIVTIPDSAGWRPDKGQTDRYGRMIPDEEYHTKDFERVVALRARTEAIARHLTDFMRRTNRFAKTIVFCVDQEHADEMRRALNNLNADLVRQHPDYVARVTADEGDIGRGHLSRFQEPERQTPVILTTSQLLTTGVDAPTCQNIVLARIVGSMTDFKQIIGRGTRVRDDYGKLYFNILDYTGSATRLFADPNFDGTPALVTEEEMGEGGETVEGTERVEQFEEQGEDDTKTGQDSLKDDSEGERRKFYVDGGRVEIAAHLVYELDADGKQLRVVRFTDYTAEKVRTLYPSAAEMRKQWADPQQRAEIIARLEERGIGFDELAAATGHPEADPFDLLCHVAFSAPLRTRRERADRLLREKKDFFDQYGPEARAILDELLEKYAEHGTAQFMMPDVLKVPPISERGNVMEIADYFGGPVKLREAVNQLQTLLYAA